jgi:enamine deaminase RidA (YjgF/YER057c/UK114 family)
MTTRASHISIVLPEGWPRAHGYSNAMTAQGKTVWLAGQIGWNPITMQIESDDLADQFATALQNMVAVLHAAGSEPSHLVRLTWFITDRDAYLDARTEIGRHYREIIGRHYPAMSVVVVSSLVEPRAKIEIEATAVIPDGSTP